VARRKPVNDDSKLKRLLGDKLPDDVQVPPLIDLSKVPKAEVRTALAFYWRYKHLVTPEGLKTPEGRMLELSDKILEAPEFRSIMKRLQIKAIKALNGILSQSMDNELRLKAAQEVFNRVHGSPKVPIELPEFAKRLKEMTDDELMGYFLSLITQTGMDKRFKIVRVGDQEPISTEPARSDAVRH